MAYVRDILGTWPCPTITLAPKVKDRAPIRFHPHRVEFRIS